jgi:hypothetical protein
MGPRSTEPDRFRTQPPIIAAVAVCLVLALVLLLPGSSHVRRCSIFVSPHGAGRGYTERGPTSLADAVARAVAGDTVCLEAGTYEVHSNVTIRHSGTQADPITITGYRGTALLRYLGATLDGGVLQTSLCRAWCASHDLVIENVTIDGGGTMDAGVFVREGARNVTVRDCVIYDTGATGIALNAVDHVSAVANRIYHAGYDQGWSSGISLWYGGSTGEYGGPHAGFDNAPGFHNFIVGNVISGEYDGSPHHTDGNGIIVDGSGEIPGALIANNLVYENGGSGIEVFDNSGDVWVVNNTAYANGLDTQHRGPIGEFYLAGARHVHLVNDIAYGAGHGVPLYTSVGVSSIDWHRVIGFGAGVAGVASSVLADPHAYSSADPRFRKPLPVPTGPRPWQNATAPWAIGNAFALDAGSPAVGSGVNALNLMSAEEAASARPYLAYGSRVDLGAAG